MKCNIISIFISLLIGFSTIPLCGQIPLNRLQAWYVGDSVVLSGGFVSQWNDITGNGYHLLQPDTSKKPEQINNALGGHSVIGFDGVNDYFQVNFGTTFGQPITIF